MYNQFLGNDLHLWIRKKYFIYEDLLKETSTINF